MVACKTAMMGWSGSPRILSQDSLFGFHCSRDCVIQFCRCTSPLVLSFNIWPPVPGDLARVDQVASQPQGGTQTYSLHRKPPNYFLCSISERSRCNAILSYLAFGFYDFRNSVSQQEGGMSNLLWRGRRGFATVSQYLLSLVPVPGTESWLFAFQW